MRFLKSLIVVIPSLLLAACGGSGGGSSDQVVVTLNSQLAIANNYLGGVVGVGTTAFAMVNEFEQDGRDLNADGDFADNVVFMIDGVTGARTNLGVAATNGIASNDTHVAWGVPEGSQGNTDLNGDGDMADRVLVIFDPTLPVSMTNPLNTGITIDPASPITGSGDTFAFVANEVNAGVDLNGDILLNDLVLQTYNTASMTGFNTGFSTVDFNFVNRFNLVLFTADEMTQETGMMGGSADINGDGMASGSILFAADSAAMTVTAIGGGAGRNVTLASARIFGTATNPSFVYSVPEGAVSLNSSGIVNDTDTSDTVCAIFDWATMTEFFPGGGVAVEDTRYAGSSTTMTFSAIENDNTDNGFDFNGDGDTDDLVPFFVALNAPTTAHNLSIAQDDGSTGLPQVCGTNILLRASESEQGPNGTNYNISQGDSDVSDNVFFFVNTTMFPINLTSLNLAGTDALCLTDSPDFVTVIATESENGASDYNNDGDTGDEIAFYFPITGGVISPNPVRVGSAGNTVIQDCGDHVRYLSFAPENYSVEFGDANQDGDFDDYILQTIRVRKVNGDTTAISVLGTVEPNIGENNFPALLTPFLLAFPTAESAIGPGINLNANMGDVDMFDSILFLSLLDCP